MKPFKVDNPELSHHRFRFNRPLYRSPNSSNSPSSPSSPSSPTSPLWMRQGKYGKYVPFLRLSGEWLLANGFEIGKKDETYAKKNQLILKTGGCSGGRGRGRGRVGSRCGGGIRFDDRVRSRIVPVGIVKDSSIT
jgi:hypothetical protein